MAREDLGKLKLDRRSFLRLVGGGAVAVATAGLTSCGGSGGGRGSIPIGTITEEDRTASLDAIEAFLATIATLPLDQQIAAALNFITPRPEFIKSGANEDGVWAIYPDGVPVMILCNRAPDHTSAAGRHLAPAAATEVPTPLGVRLINAMGDAYDDDATIVQPLFSGNGYSTFTDPGTVDSLRTVGGDGVFYMSAHGGGCSIPVFDANGNFVRAPGGGIVVQSAFGIWTSTVASPETVGPYLFDLHAGRLGIGFAIHHVGPGGVDVPERHYWFTKLFVETYMGFGTNSLVWFSACESNSTKSASFAQACITRGAGLYVGWNRTTTSQDCIDAGTFIIDRLIGANDATPHEVPNQRPFDYVEVWQDLANHVNLPSGIVYKVGANFGLLAPTIAYVLIDEFDDEAVLYGTFGSPTPNERSILIGGIEATVNSWAVGEIHCALPRTGAGSSGDVEVRVRGHKSNVRRITEWNMPITYSWIDTDLPPLSVDGPVTLRFRADVGDFRDHPGVPPLQPVRWALATRDSISTLTASGSATDKGGCLNEWLNTVDFLAGGYEPPAENVIVARLRIDTATMTGAIGLGYGALSGAPFSWRITCPPSNTVPFMVAFGLLEGAQDFLTPDPNQPPIQLPALNFPFATDFKIPAKDFVDPSFDPIHIEVKWSDVAAISPPDPDAARVALPPPGRKGF